MGTSITLNTITKISKFLSIELEIDNNKIINAHSSGLLYRSFEKLLLGRHALNALYFNVRICGACTKTHSIASSLALENALNINFEQNSRLARDFILGLEYLENHIKHFYQYTLPDYIKSGDFDFSDYSSSKDFRIPKDTTAIMINNYNKAIKCINACTNLLSVFIEKLPPKHSLFIGGICSYIDSFKINKAKLVLNEISNFISECMVNDIYILAEYYGDYFKNGNGYNNLMSYGLFNSYSKDTTFYLNPMVRIGNNLEVFNAKNITENIYCNLKNNKIDCYHDNNFSWFKAPRYRSNPMEVGPLSRMLLSNSYKGNISTMDRLIARVLEAKKIAGLMDKMLAYMKPETFKIDNYEIPVKVSGKGLIDSPRGALGHWLTISHEKINSYNIITPNGWNLSPSDSNGVHGLIEKALIGTEIEDIANPIEISRVIRSFDPSMTCTTRIINV